MITEKDKANHMKRTFFTLTICLFLLSSWTIYPKKTEKKGFSNTQIKITFNEKYYEELLKDIKNAKKSIYCVIYLIDADFNRKNDIVVNLLDSLISAKKRGLDVRVISDHNKMFWKKSKKIDFKSKKALNYLKKAGIPVFVDNINTVTHSKIVIIDERIVHIGSSNWTYSAFKMNQETNLRLLNKNLAQELQIQLNAMELNSYD